MLVLLGEFIQLVKSIPWFEHIGKPIKNAELPRLYTWAKWGNPEDLPIALLHIRQQDLYDEIIENNVSNSTDLADFFNQVVSIVIELAKKRVPYDEAEDSNYAPNTAVYHAGWTAGLIALCLMTDREPPLEIKAQWYWFREGHWPAAFTAIDSDDEPDSLEAFRIF
ncbi:MAG: hypothetical protein IPM39_28755 [Chloroflexi bacterium]|nr:hypothetical protein [Chloroflexota bacterium]